MQKLNAIQNYALVSEGQPVQFTAEPWMNEAEVGRIVTMRINTASDITLWVRRVEPLVDPDTGELDDDLRLLAHVKAGFEELYFSYVGDFVVHAVGGDFYLDTFDSSNFAVQPTDLDSYARVLEREEVDPHIAAVQYEIRKAQREFQAQREADRRDYEARLAAIEAQRASNVTPPANTSTASETGTVAEQPPLGGAGSDATVGETPSGVSGEPAKGD